MATPDEQIHEELAYFMYSRTMEHNDMGDPNLLDAFWRQEEVREHWLEEAWAVLQYLAATQDALPEGDEWAVPSPDPRYVPEEPQPPGLKPIYDDFRICEGECDLRLDEPLGVNYCSKCDFWEPAPKGGQ